MITIPPYPINQKTIRGERVPFGGPYPLIFDLLVVYILYTRARAREQMYRARRKGEITIFRFKNCWFWFRIHPPILVNLNVLQIDL